jgi:hypothetical protein
MEMKTAGGTPATWLLLMLLSIGPAAWALGLTIAYGTTAVACAHGLAIPASLQRWSLAIACAVTVAALGAAATVRARTEGDDLRAERSRFMATFACAVEAASVVLIVASATPLSVIEACHVGHA